MTIPNIQEIDVGLNGKLGFKVIKMKQYDKNTRTIKITLIEDGDIVEIPSTYIAKFQATKKDNTIVLDDCTITGNVISYTVIEQLTTVAGDVLCEIGLYEPDALGDTTKDKLIQTTTFKILVEKTAMDRNAVASSSEFNTLTIMINTLTGLVVSATQMITDVNVAINNSNTATFNANNAANLANTKAGLADTATINADTATTNANTATTAANTAKNNAVTATTNANIATTNANTATADTIIAKNNTITATTNATNATSASTTATGLANTATTNANVVATNTTNAEALRVTAETGRVNSESIRVSQENTRNGSETTRVSSESSRVTSEDTRVSSESTRVISEVNRGTAETTRDTSETTRQAYYNAYKICEVYVPATSYIVGNKVTYLGSTYQNKIACTGVLPTNNINWIQIAAKGFDGAGGDMFKSVFDPTNKATDIFAYVDNQKGAVNGVATLDANAKLSLLQIPESISTFQSATGTATAISLLNVTLIDGYSKTFIVSASNTGLATTINTKPLYKPNTTTAPNLIAGKAVTVWYNLIGDCFFIKASAEGDAVAANVLASKTFSNDIDNGIVGAMTNNGAVTNSLAINGTYTVPAGYHNGSGAVTQTITTKAATTYLPLTTAQTISSGQYLSGSQTIASTTGTAAVTGVLAGQTFNSANGIGLTGAMPNQGAIVYMPSTVQQAIPAGYHNGGGYIVGDADLIASNILNTANLFGVQGTAVAGKKFASGTVTPAWVEIALQYLDGQALTNQSWWVTVSGLSFKPSLIILKSTAATIERLIIYRETNGFYPKVVELCTSSSTTTSGSILTVKGDVGAYSMSGGFRLPSMNASELFTWYAYE